MSAKSSRSDMISLASYFVSSNRTILPVKLGALLLRLAFDLMLDFAEEGDLWQLAERLLLLPFLCDKRLRLEQRSERKLDSGLSSLDSPKVYWGLVLITSEMATVDALMA